MKRARNECPADGGAVATFSTASQVALEEVTVLGKDGKPMEGLTKKDFTTTEDGVAQEIAFFDDECVQATIAENSCILQHLVVD